MSVPTCRRVDVFPQLCSAPGQGHVSRLQVLPGCESTSPHFCNPFWGLTLFFLIAADWAGADRRGLPLRSVRADQDQPALVTQKMPSILDTHF